MRDNCMAMQLQTLSFQVVMGYSHSLVIARQDTEQEKEKLKKLPEYNPRTLWLDTIHIFSRGFFFFYGMPLLTRSPG